MLRSGLPLHEQISEWLRERILSGELAPHDRLPSEHELRRRFEVSRVTVRRALQTLETDGLIYRRQGLGSFVSDGRVTHGLVRLTDFAQDLERAGLEASSRVLHREYEPCPDEVATRLEVEPGARVLRLDRLRLGDGEPIALDRTWLPLFYAQLLEAADLGLETIYGVLERDFGIPILSGRYRITAAPADEGIAEHLQVPPGEALLLIERISRSAADRPVYFQRRYYRSDRIAYELELARDPEEARRRVGEGAGGMPLREFEPVFHPGAPGKPAEGGPGDGSGRQTTGARESPEAEPSG